MVKKLFKYLYVFLFTIRKDIKEKESIPHEIKMQLMYKILLSIVLFFLVFVSFNNLIINGISFNNIVDGFLILLFLRIILNELTDHIIFTLFHKNAYKTPPKSEIEMLFINRKIKLKRIKRKMRNGNRRYLLLHR